MNIEWPGPHRHPVARPDGQYGRCGGVGFCARCSQELLRLPADHPLREKYRAAVIPPPEVSPLRRIIRRITRRVFGRGRP